MLGIGLHGTDFGPSSCVHSLFDWSVLNYGIGSVQRLPSRKLCFHYHLHELPLGSVLDSGRELRLR